MCSKFNANASAPLHPVANSTITKDRITNYHVGAVGVNTKSAKIFIKCTSKPTFLEYLVAGLSYLCQYLCAAVTYGVFVGKFANATPAHS